MEVTLMPFALAPFVSFSAAELARLRELRRAFLRRHSLTPHDCHRQEE
jgi:hypothetical protein